jgi:hypothetical protein
MGYDSSRFVVMSGLRLRIHRMVMMTDERMRCGFQPIRVMRLREMKHGGRCHRLQWQRQQEAQHGEMAKAASHGVRSISMAVHPPI